MRRYNIVSWILPVLTVITFALAAPTLVQDKRQAYVDVVHVPKDVITALKKRMDGELGMWHEYYDFMVAHAHQEVPAPPPMAPNEFHDFMVGHAHQEEPVPPPNVPPPNPVDSDREVMDVDDDAPAWSSESEDSYSEPPSPRPSTNSEDFHTTPPSPVSSTKSEDFQTAPPTPGGSSTKSEGFQTAPSSPGPDSDSGPSSMASNLPNTGRQSERRASYFR